MLSETLKNVRIYDQKNSAILFVTCTMIIVSIFKHKQSLLALSTSSSYTHINHPVQKRYGVSRGLEDIIINEIEQLNSEGID